MDLRSGRFAALYIFCGILFYFGRYSEDVGPGNSMESQSKEPSQMARYDYEELQGAVCLVGCSVAVSSG
jgi:hypothetical protein